MHEFISLPFFTTDRGKVRYLDQYEVLDISELPENSSLATQLLLDESVLIKRHELSKGTKQAGRILVIEPHPDDFALSAAAYALPAISQGHSVRILNLFTKTALEHFSWKGKVTVSEKDLEELRVIESKIAIEDYLDQEFKSLKLPTAALRGNSDPFRRQHPESEILDMLTGKISQEIKDTAAAQVLCPLGVGGHIDHLLAFEATLKLYRIDPSFELILYAEYPYARNHEAFRSRLDQVGSLLGLESLYVNTGDYVEPLCDLISIYRSQFDDINRKQMLAVISEDFRAIASETAARKTGGHSEFMQKYYRTKEAL